MKKYIPVFGPQELFDGAPDDAEMAYETANHVRVYYKKCNSLKFFSNSKWVRVLNEKAMIIHAMRRIICTPVWTKADQEAGKLPEIGCEYIGRGVLLACVFVDKNGDIWGKSKESLMYVHQSSEIKPIETEAERQQREREEWVNHAYEKLISADVKGKASLGDIYDALLSGELKAPKGGE